MYLSYCNYRWVISCAKYKPQRIYAWWRIWLIWGASYSTCGRWAASTRPVARWGRSRGGCYWSWASWGLTPSGSGSYTLPACYFCLLLSTPTLGSRLPSTAASSPSSSTSLFCPPAYSTPPWRERLPQRNHQFPLPVTVWLYLFVSSSAFSSLFLHLYLIGLYWYRWDCSPWFLRTLCSSTRGKWRVIPFPWSGPRSGLVWSQVTRIFSLADGTLPH